MEALAFLLAIFVGWPSLAGWWLAHAEDAYRKSRVKLRNKDKTNG